MRHLVTFILRLWVEAEADSQNWEGQVECVATGEQMHVHNHEDIARFIDARLHVPECDPGQAITWRDESPFNL